MGTPQNGPRRLRQKRRRAKKEQELLMQKLDKAQAPSAPKTEIK
jgi:hypothetical protein